MDGSFQAMLKSELLNRLALNLDTAEAFGPIVELWVNGRTHQVRGIGCSAGGLLNRQSQRFLWSQVGSIGRDGVVVKAGARVEAIDEHLQDCLPLAELELWSDHGDRMGQLIDYRFDPASGNILQYLFVPAEASSLAPGLYALDPVAVNARHTGQAYPWKSFTSRCSDAWPPDRQPAVPRGADGSPSSGIPRHDSLAFDSVWPFLSWAVGHPKDRVRSVFPIRKRYGRSDRLVLIHQSDGASFGSRRR